MLFEIIQLVDRIFFPFRSHQKLVTSWKITKVLVANAIDTVSGHHHATHTEHASIFRFVRHRPNG